MMNGNGLSAMRVEPQGPTQEDMNVNPVQEGGEAGGITIEQVIQLLMSGKDPQELAEAGVPIELIKQAIQVIQQQVQAQQEQGQVPQQGGLSQIGMQ